MTVYNPKYHNRKSIRLKGYDYASSGLYFVTICVQNRLCLFGDITQGNMVLNQAGKMVDIWYKALENKFSNIKCREYIIMPNHFHGIIEIVGADQRVCPNHNINTQNHLGNPKQDLSGQPNIEGEHTGSPLHQVIQWFKTMTTNAYIRNVKQNNWKRFDGKLWQRNYYEHIIRNHESYYNISKYIINNPLTWEKDKLNPDQ